MKYKLKQFSESTRYRIMKYVELLKVVLLLGAGVLAIYAVFNLHLDGVVRWLAGFAALYAIVEAITKFDEAFIKK